MPIQVVPEEMKSSSDKKYEPLPDNVYYGHITEVKDFKEGLVTKKGNTDTRVAQLSLGKHTAETTLASLGKHSPRVTFS